MVFVLGKPREAEIDSYPLDILELAGLQPHMLQWLRITGQEPSLPNASQPQDACKNKKRQIRYLSNFLSEDTEVFVDF